MRHPVLLTTALLFAAGPALALEAVTYAGTVGGKNVVLELAVSPEGVPQAGRFAELAKGFDVPLHAAEGSGALSDGAIRLREEKPCTVELCGNPREGEETKPAFGAEWVLESDGENVVLSGTRRDLATGETTPVTLDRKGMRDLPDAIPPLEALDPHVVLYSGSPGAALTPENFPYDFLKQDVPLTPGPDTAVGAGKVRMDEDPRTKLAFPIVTALDGMDPGALNEGLAALKLQSALPSFGCLSAVYHGFGWFNEDAQGGDGYEGGGTSVTVDHLSPRLMALTESGSFWCGGAHPSNFSEHSLLDARTGQPVIPETFLRGWQATGRDGEPVDPATYDNSDYSLVQGPNEELVAFVRERRRKQFDAEQEESCFYDELVATNLAVTVKGESLVFTLQDLPHAIAACKEDLLEIPLADARPLLTDEAAAHFPVLDR
ncbi:MAG TPA: hypothetical protein VGN97_06735 [Mesorhizobium sp.]|jgi:hypothetical protein|nr:hypothetical protein [Mesorhizobium sp.]